LRRQPANAVKPCQLRCCGFWSEVTLASADGELAQFGSAGHHSKGPVRSIFRGIRRTIAEGILRANGSGEVLADRLHLVDRLGEDRFAASGSGEFLQ
jgi:hypothetical protein